MARSTLCVQGFLDDQVTPNLPLGLSSSDRHFAAGGVFVFPSAAGAKVFAESLIMMFVRRWTRENRSPLITVPIILHTQSKLYRCIHIKDQAVQQPPQPGWIFQTLWLTASPWVPWEIRHVLLWVHELPSVWRRPFFFGKRPSNGCDRLIRQINQIEMV